MVGNLVEKKVVHWVVLMVAKTAERMAQRTAEKSVASKVG